MKSRITIAGLGWLGMAFAAHMKNLGFIVKGSVTDASKAARITQQGIMAFPVLIGENGVSGMPEALLSETDVLVIMIPPGLRKNTGANYALKMAHFLHHIEKAAIKKVILISSTAVYDDTQGIVTEKVIPTPKTNAAKQLFEVEQLFFNSPVLQTSIVRFGGLFGGSRHPVRFLAGREDLSNGEAPVNLIHRQDCIGILKEIIIQDQFGHIFNAVAPSHPTKKEYYKKQAERMQLTPPQYAQEAISTFKTVESVHLESLLNYEFLVALEE